MVLLVRMGTGWARERFATQLVARLATVDAGGRPHVVPIVFAASDDTIYTAIDAKPKSGAPLRRLANMAVNPQVSVLVDHYDDDWTRLWWARADGSAGLLASADPAAQAGLAALAARYPQYVTQPPPGPLVVIAVRRWTGWSATEPPDAL